MVSIFCSVCAVSCIEFLMESCICDESFVTILMKDKKLLHFKISKLHQILHVDKTKLVFSGQLHIMYVTS